MFGEARLEGDLYILPPRDEEPFHALHRRIAGSGLKFFSSPRPYRPYCPLAGWSAVNARGENEDEILTTAVEEAFALDTRIVCTVTPPPAPPRPAYYQTIIDFRTRTLMPMPLQWRILYRTGLMADRGR